MHRLAIFASGNGSNAENIARYFSHHSEIKVAAVFTDQPDAYVLQRASLLSIPSFVFTMAELKDPAGVIKQLEQLGVDFIILAGFMRLIPGCLIKKYQNKIINIHPALLPLYGGKGMYGMNVHQAVKNNSETETGITIHFVNEHYDEGEIIFQAKTPILESDTVDSIAQKVHQLEYEHYPKIIEQVILNSEKK